MAKYHHSGVIFICEFCRCEVPEYHVKDKIKDKGYCLCPRCDITAWVDPQYIGFSDDEDFDVVTTTKDRVT